MSKETMTMSTPTAHGRQHQGIRLLALLLGLTVALVLAASLSQQAHASQEILEYNVSSSDTQAGAHPDLGAKFKLANPGQPEVAKDIAVELPAGIFGNPGAIYKCRALEFAFNECASGAQAGIVKIVANYQSDPSYVLGTAPVYNMEPVGDETGRLAFVAPIVNVPVTIPVNVRSATDYGLTLNVTGIPQEVPLNFADFTIWGYPADSSHGPERFRPGAPGEPPACIGILSTGCLSAPYAQAGLFVRPYTDNPSRCTGQPLPVRMEVTTYQDPNNATTANSTWPATTGCEQQKFDPVFNLGLTTNETDAPSGLDIQLKANQFLDGEGAAPSQLRSATLTLPPGLTVNPDAADGQTSCSDAQAGFGSDAPGACPDNAKIGTIDVRTPALDGPLVGSLYIGEPKPGNQYRVFMIFDGFGVHAKLVAEVHPDPRTGQLTMAVGDLPEVPFEEFNLHLFASDRGLMATPTQCSIYTASSVLTPWNSTAAPQNSSPSVSLTSGPKGKACPGQVRSFAPRLVAGTRNPQAGGFSPFTLKLDRDDGDQFLGDLNFRLPPGFTGSLRGITYCPEAAIAAAAQNAGRSEATNPSCPASSQIGTTNVAAGPGNHPFHAQGRMYLSGPLKGAPLSLAAVTPALAGPYDYGTQVVRVALHVDRRTAQVSAISDTVPSIIGGIPLRLRSIQVNIDRPNFTINPTNCSPFTVDSQGIGDQGSVTDFSSYFQVVNCRTLPFKPKMRIKQLGKRKETKRTKNPRLRFDLRTRPGDANLQSVAVTLPKSFAIDQRHLGNICSRAQLEAEECAGRQPMGHVFVRTPLLDEPLKGPAYAVSGFGKLPRVAFVLAGQVTLVPQAESRSVKNGFLKTTVPIIPDAPIGHFRLTLLGGSKGYLVNTRDLCSTKSVVKIDYVAQSGRKLTQRVKTKTPCGKRKGARRSNHR
jgi:hypothetical protein